MSVSGRRAASRRRQASGPADPYWASRVLVANFDGDLVDAKGHTLTPNTSGYTFGADYLNTLSRHFTLGGPTDFEIGLGADATAQSFAIEAWMQHSAGSGNCTLLSVGGGNGSWSLSGGHMFMFWTVGTTLQIDRTNNGNYASIAASNAAPYDQKLCLRAVFDGDRLSLYAGTARVTSQTGVVFYDTSASPIARIANNPANDQPCDMRLYALRVTKGGTGGLDPNQTTLALPTDPFPTHG